MVIHVIELHFYSTDGLSVGVLTALNKFNPYLNRLKIAKKQILADLICKLFRKKAPLENIHYINYIP